MAQQANVIGHHMSLMLLVSDRVLCHNACDAVLRCCSVHQLALCPDIFRPIMGRGPEDI